MKRIPFEELFAEPSRNGVTYPSERRGQGVPMVNMKEAFAYDFIGDQDCERVPLTDTELGRYLLEEGDLLFVRQSLKYEGAGRVVLVCAGTEPRTWESHLIRVRLNKRLAIPRYYYYYFRSPAGRSLVQSVVEQVAAAGIRGSDLRRLVVPWPEVHDQERVAQLLGSLDDKIMINDRIANTALDLAATQYVFASRGWTAPQLVPLGDAARWLSGGTPRTDEPDFWNGEVPWISAVSLRSPWIDDSSRKLTSTGVRSGTRLVPNETIIFVVRGMSLKTEFRIGITQCEVAFGQDCKALVANERLDPYFLFYSLFVRRNEILGMVDEAGHGTGRLQSDRLARLAMPVPSQAEQDNLASLLRPLSEIAATKQRESRTLSKLRDTLLSALISGELKIKNTRRLQDEAI
jgi:type I restriction enzyme S subunit